MGRYPLPTAVEEAELVSGCRNGDAQAFDELYRRYAPALRAYCRSKLRHSAHAEDVTHEAMIKVFDALPRFKDGAHFWSYLATIAANLCVDEHRRESRLASFVADHPHSPEIHDEYEQSERVQLVRDALPTLPIRYRTLLRLQGLEGWSLSEIAEFEGLSVPAVKSALMRARRALRGAVQRLAQRRGSWPLSGLALVPRPIRRRLTALAERMPRLSGWQEVAPGLVRAPEAIAALIALAIVGTLAVMHGPSNLEPTQGGRSSHSVATDHALPPGSSSPSSSAPSLRAGQDLIDHSRTIIAPGESAQPEDTVVSSFAASQSNSAGHEVFASGFLAANCGRPTCPMLFKSSDGGASWVRLEATGFAGGQILLPPGFPADARFFAAGPVGLQTSLDGGETFVTLVPVSGPTVISPAFGSGDPRILIGAAPTWEYRDDLGTARPLATAVMGGVIVNYAFAPKYPSDDRLFAGGTTVSGTSTQSSAVFLCDRLSACRMVSGLEGSKGAPALRVSSFLDEDQTLLAIASGRGFKSSDGGATFAMLSAPSGLRDLALDPRFGASRLFAATLREGATLGGVWRSLDAGGTWSRLSSNEPRLAPGTSSILVTATGRLFAALRAGDGAGAGLLCSSDGGSSWAPRCTRQNG